MSAPQLEQLIYHARLKDQLTKLLAQRERLCCAITAAIDAIDEKTWPKITAELRAALKEARQ